MPHKQAPYPAPETKEMPRQDAGHTMHAIAAVGIATIGMLENLLPALAKEVERESRSLSDHFIKLIAYSQAQERLIETLLKESDDPRAAALRKKAEDTILHAEDAAKQVVIAMQFQDRNSQVMHNVTQILERYRIMLEDIRYSIETAHNNTLPNGETISHAVENILSSIRLSDIRARYMDALNKAKVPSRNDQESTDTASDTGSDVELF